MSDTKPRRGMTGDPTVAIVGMAASSPDADAYNRVHLQVDFLSGHTLTISWPIDLDDGEPPSVCLSTPVEERPGFDGLLTLERLREWLKGALGQEPWPHEDPPRPRLRLVVAEEDMPPAKP